MKFKVGCVPPGRDRIGRLHDRSTGRGSVESLSAKEFDERFDAGESMAAALDATRMRRPGEEHRRVNVDFPVWMIAALDREATRLGVTRQSLIRVWIAEKLDRGKHPLPKNLDVASL